MISHLSAASPVWRIFVCASFLLLSACGGGGGGSPAPAPDPAPSALTYPSPTTAVVGQSMTALTPIVSGSVTSWSVSPALPAGIALNGSNGRIGGTPTAVAAQATYTITAGNATGSTTFALSLTVNAAPPTSLSYPSPVNAVVNQAITPINPTVTGSVASYSVTPALPAGLNLNTTSGQISGTPNTVTAQATYTITATNPSGNTSFGLALTVSAVPPPAPSALSYPSPRVYTVGVAIATLTPTVTGTVSTYSVAPALPAGLSISASTGQISGTPTAATAAADYTVTAGNSSGSTTFALNIAVVLAAPTGLSYAGPQTYIVGTAITPLSPTVTGSVATFGVAPALPAGLTLNTGNGVISGTPTAATAAANYTITASNASGNTAFALNITVKIAAPSGLSYAGPQTYTVGTAITPLSPTVTGTVASYAVTPPLPAGLTLNTTSGQITGTPTAATAAANYTVTATNSSGNTTFALNITVKIPAPSGLSYLSPQTYAVGTAITPLSPTITGTVTSYSVLPALPAGLLLNTSTGQITGTPTAATASASYTITATNSSGSTTFALSIVVNGVPAAPTVTVGYGLKQVTLSWSAVSGATYYRVLKNPDGSSGYTQLGSNQTAVTYADVIAVHLTDWLNASYIVEACNTFGCNGSTAAFATDSVKAIGYFKASDTEQQDGFGNAVALSLDGNTLAVSAPGKDSNANGASAAGTNIDAAGAVYVFVRSGSAWTQQAFLTASNRSFNLSAGFGNSLSLSADGNTLAVGMDRETSSSVGVNGDQNNSAASQSGAVYVFVRNGAAWSQQAYVKASNTHTGAAFGHAVSLSSDGNTLAASAHIESSAGVGINGSQAYDSNFSGTGSVYVFTRSGTTWSQQVYIKPSNTISNQEFGNSLSLAGNGNLLAVGSTNESSNAAGVYNPTDRIVYSGAVYMFARSGATWTQQAYIKASDLEYGLHFGTAVALSTDGTTLGVGANASNATGWNSRAYVLTQNNGTWSEQAIVHASNHDSQAAYTEEFGDDIALSSNGNILVVGAQWEASNATGINGDQTNRASIGAGAAYLFRRTGSAWAQTAYIKASNTRAQNVQTFGGDFFAFPGSVSLAGDGQTLAVGGFGDDSSATGIGGNQGDDPIAGTDSGALYLY